MNCNDPEWEVWLSVCNHFASISTMLLHHDYPVSIVARKDGAIYRFEAAPEGVEMFMVDADMKPDQVFRVMLESVRAAARCHTEG